jgi:hypothetical protein
MKPIMKRYKQERHNSNNYNEMIKKITKITLILFICLDAFLLYKAINSYMKISTFEKKTAWVKYCDYYKGGARWNHSKELRLKLGDEKEVTQLEKMATSISGKPDIIISIGRLSIRSFPTIEFKDKITYYLMKDSLFKEPKVIGLSSSKEPMSKFQLFLDIYQHYVNSYIFFLPFIICFLLDITLKKIFKVEDKDAYLMKAIMYRVPLFIIL